MTTKGMPEHGALRLRGRLVYDAAAGDHHDGFRGQDHAAEQSGCRATDAQVASTTSFRDARFFFQRTRRRQTERVMPSPARRDPLLRKPSARRRAVNCRVTAA